MRKVLASIICGAALAAPSAAGAHERPLRVHLRMRMDRPEKAWVTVWTRPSQNRAHVIVTVMCGNMGEFSEWLAVSGRSHRVGLPLNSTHRHCVLRMTARTNGDWISATAKERP